MNSQADFREEKTLVETFINARGHGCIMLPKFHCDLNPIEQCCEMILVGCTLQ